ncbi:LysR family transcriptional regulator YnfL [Serratia rubidaea]|uniref:LysR family transcriptional regulator n=1 Tax=Serratia rubidaea TaxID=61652 RepID=UPI000774251E|nr:LysR substrate-binding domain-containing protein [Serratia rubidaea]AML58458.1 LysR family transcriptional regulator YnfL [Serratia rubidaea]
MNIELRHLRYFIAVAEELHFGRAAQRLRISQPPLSQQIQALEEMVGARLLARNNRNVSLTQAGEMFLKEAWQVIDQVNRAAEKAARLERGESGELTIGFTSSAPFIGAVARNLRAFRQSHPDVHIKMREINTKQQLEPLLNGELDLGVMRNTRLPEALQHTLLLREPMLAVVPEGHPLAQLAPDALHFHHLAQEPFVFFSREVGTALYDETLLLLENAGITPYITQEVGEAMTIIGLVSAGLGVSILPASFGRVKLDGVKYLPLAEPQAQTEVWLVHHRQRPLTAAARTLMQMMLTGSAAAV